MTKKVINYDFSKHDKVVVWHGDNVDELLMLYMICSIVKGKLYEADITQVERSCLNSVNFPLALAHSSPDNIEFMYNKISPISDESKYEYSLLWDKWSKSKAPLRLIKNNREIFEVDEEYFDDKILSKCNNEYRKASRVIGNVLLTSEQLIGDVFLLNRLIFLVNQNKLTARNNPEFTKEIEESNRKNNIVGVNMTRMGLFSVKL